MDKIDLRIIQQQAKEDYIAGAKVRAEKFVKEQVVPKLIQEAEKMRCYANILVPGEIFVEDVVNGIKEVVLCESIEVKGRKISVWWI